ncbi:hypothetical protein [Sphingosinicella sp. YJ22]|uniref:hypothetical protein n=1 Tax=Sphingosinicella sp. YJ22 TaxID=1104780 RepID=UPI001407E575|nr:hypothetical protein [Sphingosinicella sp. YJ22]
MMKRFIITLAALPIATMAVEASAQTYVTSNANANATVQNQIVQLQTQLNAGVRAGTIDATERRRLRQEIRTLTRLRARYAANGISQQEWNVLQQRVGNLSQQLQVAGGAYAYGYAQPGAGYAYGNTGYTYDQYGRRVLAPGYTYDQYGRPVPVQNGYYGQGGPYAPYPQTRTNSGVGNVLGGVLGSVLGGGGMGGNILGSILGNGGLRVGDLITGTIGSVLRPAPSTSYQGRSDVYFRSDGQRVYEIDARTNQVIAIHPLR